MQARKVIKNLKKKKPMSMVSIPAYVEGDNTYPRTLFLLSLAKQLKRINPCHIKIKNWPNKDMTQDDVDELFDFLATYTHCPVSLDFSNQLDPSIHAFYIKTKECMKKLNIKIILSCKEHQYSMANWNEQFLELSRSTHTSQPTKLFTPKARRVGASKEYKTILSELNNNRR